MGFAKQQTTNLSSPLLAATFSDHESMANSCLQRPTAPAVVTSEDMPTSVASIKALFVVANLLVLLAASVVSRRLFLDISIAISLDASIALSMVTLVLTCL